MNALDVYELDYLPPDMLLEENHPLNDSFLQSTNRVQQRIMAESAKLGPKRTRAVKLRYGGAAPADIATQIGVTPTTVSKYLNSTAGKRLMALLHVYAASLAGATQAQRKQSLWDIACDNKEGRPQVAISAIKTLNDMDMELKATDRTPQSINIQINNEHLPRTSLDNG